jgi:hypothetical protein
MKYPFLSIVPAIDTNIYQAITVTKIDHISKHKFFLDTEGIGVQHARETEQINLYPFLSRIPIRVSLLFCRQSFLYCAVAALPAACP